MKTSFPTLDQIREAVKEVAREVVKDEGKIIIAAFDRDLKFLEGRINSLDDGLNSLTEKVYKGFAKVDKRFDDNDNAHQEIIGAIEEIAERKIKQQAHEKHSFVAA